MKEVTQSLLHNCIWALHLQKQTLLKPKSCFINAWHFLSLESSYQLRVASKQDFQTVLQLFSSVWDPSPPTPDYSSSSFASVPSSHTQLTTRCHPRPFFPSFDPESERALQAKEAPRDNKATFECQQGIFFWCIGQMQQCERDCVTSFINFCFHKQKKRNNLSNHLSS